MAIMAVMNSSIHSSIRPPILDANHQQQAAKLVGFHHGRGGGGRLNVVPYSMEWQQIIELCYVVRESSDAQLGRRSCYVPRSM